MINIATILKHNVIGKLINHVIIFLINVFIVRCLGASVSGTYFNELYALNFVVFIFSAGLDYSAIALLSREPNLLAKIHKMLFKVVLVFAALMALYVFIIVPAGKSYFEQTPVAIILFSTGNLLLIFYQGILSALKKFNRQNIILGITNALFLAWLLMLNNNKAAINIGFIQTVYAILFFVQGLLMWGFSWNKTVPVNITVSLKIFVKTGIYIMISSLIYFAFLRIDNFFVEKYTDHITLGNYVQCGKTGQYFLYFSSVISSTLLPFISSETFGSSFSEWKKIMKPYIILLCWGALFIALSGQKLFPLLLGEDFRGMYSFMIILLPGFVCLGILTLMNAVYIGKGNIRKILIGDIMGLIIVCGFDAWLVPEYGARAAAIISSSAYCFVFLYLVLDFKKQFLLPSKNTGIVKL